MPAAVKNPVLRRAYSLLEIKSFDEETRTFEGIATTPSTDRVGDIVEPMGAQFKLPIPLLWQHGRGSIKDPVGWVTDAQPTPEGIPVKGKFAKVDAPPSLKEDLDRAWALVKSKLVRGLSIGFGEVDGGTEPIKGTFGLRFTKWDWVELSAVTIPANADANIQTVRSLDQAFLDPRSRISSPGASGISFKSKEQHTMTIKEHIAALEAARAAKKARMEALMKVAADKGETLGTAEAEEFDTTNAEVERIDADLTRLKALSKENAAAAEPVITVKTDEAGRPLVDSALAPAMSGIRVTSRLEPGQKFARYAMAIGRAKGNIAQALAAFRAEKAWMDTSPEVELVLRTAVNAGDTTTAGWASELVYAQNLANEFIEYLRPKTIIGRVPNWRRVPFNVRMASQTAGSSGYWIGQGLAIPLTKLTTGSTSLGITKVAGLVVADEELIRSSSPSAELRIRDDLTGALVQVADLSLIDPNQGGTTNVQPASLLYGVTQITPTGITVATLDADLKSLFSTAIAAEVDITQGVWVMSPTTALALSLIKTSLGVPQFPTIGITGGTFQGLPVITSNAANIAGSPQFGQMMVVIFPQEVFLADEGGVVVDMSNQASIEMVDSGSSSQKSTATSTGASLVSMFQTNSEALRAIKYINWSKRRASAAAFIAAAAYTG